MMELVEGETLAERISGAPMPIDETLKIVHQIVEALEAAHEKGIVHRDLKPANVKITPEGKVKVLDFGLAKAMENAPANGTLSQSPTLSLSMAATNAGRDSRYSRLHVAGAGQGVCRRPPQRYFFARLRPL